MFRWAFSRGVRTAVFLMTGAVCCGQTPPAPAPDTPAPADPAAARSPEPSPKKVWTNDDFRAHSHAAAPGEKRNQKYATTKPVDGATKPVDAAAVLAARQNLQKLQTQLDDVNKKLASFKQFEEGEAVSSGARQLDKGYSRMPVDQQVTALEEKKKKLEAQIDDVLDDARKKGIESGQLRVP